MKTLNRIKSKTKFKLTFKGEPNTNVSVVDCGESVGVSPIQFQHIKPKVVVSVGDSVKRGQALFFDKKNPQVYFHSPVSGVVESIEYGQRRSLQLIKIAKANLDDPIKFDVINVDSNSSTEIKSALLERGLWSQFQQLPFKNIPQPDANIPAIIVQCSNPEPFHPKLSVFLGDVEAAIIQGIQALKKLTDHVVLFADANEQMNLDRFSEVCQVVRVDGDFSQCNSASVTYHLKDDPKYNQAWVCDWQTLVKVANTFQTGAYHSQQYISVGGNQVQDNQHYQVTEGVKVNDFLTKRNAKDRMVFGGLFSGVHTNNESYLPMGADAINIIDNDPETEFMSFLQPGLEKPSFTTAYVSGFFNAFRSLVTTSALNGSLRDCVSCGYCEDVCPVDALPQNILRNIKADEVEESFRFGLLDCSSCGVCTYVCPSKIDLASAFDQAKQQLFEEVNA